MAKKKEENPTLNIRISGKGEEEGEEEEGYEIEEEEPKKPRFYEKRSYNKKQARESGRKFYYDRLNTCKKDPRVCASELAQDDCEKSISGKKLIADCQSSVRFAKVEKPKKKSKGIEKDLEKIMSKKGKKE